MHVFSWKRESSATKDARGGSFRSAGDAGGHGNGNDERAAYTAADSQSGPELRLSLDRSSPAPPHQPKSASLRPSISSRGQSNAATGAASGTHGASHDYAHGSPAAPMHGGGARAHTPSQGKSAPAPQHMTLVQYGMSLGLATGEVSTPTKSADSAYRSLAFNPPSPSAAVSARQTGFRAGKYAASTNKATAASNHPFHEASHMLAAGSASAAAALLRTPSNGMTAAAVAAALQSYPTTDMPPTYSPNQASILARAASTQHPVSTHTVQRAVRRSLDHAPQRQAEPDWRGRSSDPDAVFPPGAAPAAGYGSPWLASARQSAGALAPTVNPASPMAPVHVNLAPVSTTAPHYSTLTLTTAAATLGTEGRSIGAAGLGLPPRSPTTSVYQQVMRQLENGSSSSSSSRQQTYPGLAAALATSGSDPASPAGGPSDWQTTMGRFGSGPISSSKARRSSMAYGVDHSTDLSSPEAGYGSPTAHRPSTSHDGLHMQRRASLGLPARGGAAGIMDHIADVHLLQQAENGSDSGGGQAWTQGGSGSGTGGYGHSRRASLNSQFGTLTCLKTSTFASNFGAAFTAESQGDMGYYQGRGSVDFSGQAADEPTSPGPGSLTQHELMLQELRNPFHRVPQPDSPAACRQQQQQQQPVLQWDGSDQGSAQAARAARSSSSELQSHAQQQQQQAVEVNAPGSRGWQEVAAQPKLPATAPTRSSFDAPQAYDSSRGSGVPSSPSPQPQVPRSPSPSSGLGGDPAKRRSFDEVLTKRLSLDEGVRTGPHVPGTAVAAGTSPDPAVPAGAMQPNGDSGSGCSDGHPSAPPAAAAALLSALLKTAAAIVPAAAASALVRASSMHAEPIPDVLRPKSPVCISAAYLAVAAADAKQQAGQAQGRSSVDDAAREAGAVAAAAAAAAARALERVEARKLLGAEPDEEHSAALPGYSVGKVIGEGGFCMVRIGVHHLSKRKVAIKIVDKSRLTDPNEAKRMQREIRVMKHLSHECIIKLFEVVDAEKMLYLVMEHAPSGSLLDYVRSRKRMAEGDAAHALQQIMAGLEFCHRREVVHRDVKLENILLDSNNRMKLIDFGLSAFFIPGKKLKVHCGSPSYAAPEIVARKQYDGPPVDVWSMGVVLFAMLAGYLPFHSSNGNKQDLCNKIMEGKYSAPESMSASAKDLLAKMLTVDPARRITFEQVWQHPWVQQAPRWEPLGASIYDVRVDSTSGAVYADEQLLLELEAAGHPRGKVLQALLRGEANSLTAAYFLLAEAKADRSKSSRFRQMRGGSSSGESLGGIYSAAGGSSGPPKLHKGSAGPKPVITSVYRSSSGTRQMIGAGAG